MVDNNFSTVPYYSPWFGPSFLRTLINQHLYNQSLIPYTSLILCHGSLRVVLKPVTSLSPENLLETQMFSFHPKPTAEESLDVATVSLILKNF
jgi:hypothetical protein